MKPTICQIEPNRQAVQVRQFEEMTIPWVQLGDSVLLLPTNAQQDTLLAYAERGGFHTTIYPRDVRAKDLHLVIQEGRLFQQRYPQTRIVVDKGRYLVVELPAKQARQIKADRIPGFVIQQLASNKVIFELRPEPITRAAPLHWVQDLVDRVIDTNFETTLNHLTSHLTRYSTTSYYLVAVAWCQQQLDAMGYSTHTENVSIGDDATVNLIAEKVAASTGTSQLVLLVAHLDSINRNGGPNAQAPGADDNGSGSAALLEIARILKDHTFLHDLRLIFLGGEEQGLCGSTHYVSRLSVDDRQRIRAVINMDMIGALNTSPPTVLLEGAPISQRVINTLAEIAETYTVLRVQTSLYPYASDHVPFIEANLPAVLTIEGAESANQHVHTENDTLETIQATLALEIARMNLAFAALELNPVAESHTNQWFEPMLNIMMKSG